MSEKDLNISRRVQLEILQNRIGLHGSRMWQLPLTYLGAIAISLTAASSDGVNLPIEVIFYLMAILGFIVTWCLRGAEEAYTRAANNMRELEKELRLQQYTRAKGLHRYPYYALMVFGILCCLAAAILLTK